MNLQIKEFPNCRYINSEVYYSEKLPFIVTSSLLDSLRKIAIHNLSGKVRICCHLSADDNLHDMLIALHSKADIRPHSHLYKIESFHIIDGSLKIIIYDAIGKIVESIILSSINYIKDDESAFYIKMPAGVIHSVIPITESVIFREVTNGPFKPEDTIYPVWAIQKSV